MPFAPRIAFLDTETTGMSPARCRITEVGLVLVEQGPQGWQVREWSSLINPGQPIPAAIRALTGISEAMVREAPRFETIAGTLLDMLQDTVLVAHQARFDYGFLRAEMQRAGLHFQAPTLCTVRLSRRLDPDRGPHSLDAIIDRYRLPAQGRHRALGDARVLWHFVQALARRHSEAMLRETVRRLLRHPGLPSHLDADALEAVPHGPGVYAMLGAGGQPLYVGRSRDIRKRLASHFSAEPERERHARLAAETHQLQWRRTAGEFGACLLESQWIRERQPSHNIALRQSSPVFVQLAPESARPRIVAVHSLAPEHAVGLYGPFASRAGARALLQSVADAAGLCLVGLGLEKRPQGQPCFRRQLGRCAGACVGEQAPLDLRSDLMRALVGHAFQAWPYAGPIALVEQDPQGGEDWHVFEHWRHLGSTRHEAAARALVRDRQGKAELDPGLHRLLRAQLQAMQTGNDQTRIRLVQLGPQGDTGASQNNEEAVTLA